MLLQVPEFNKLLRPPLVTSHAVKKKFKFLIVSRLILILFSSYSRFSERGSHRSEGEYEEERFVDRKEYDGKWADGNEPERNHTEEKTAVAEPPAPAEKE